MPRARYYPTRLGLLISIGGAILAFLLAPKSLAADEALSFRGGMTWISAYQGLQLREDHRNPDNEVMQLPQNQLVSQIRPNLKVIGNSLQLIVRPLVTFTYSQTKIGDEFEPARPHSDSKINEAFIQWTVSESITFAYGKQSYQWGAAESVNPSNRMFHETVLARDLLYDVKGKYLARINYSMGKTFSAILMSEYDEDTNDKTAYRAEETFAPTSLVKLEANWNEGADYFGLVGGAREREGKPWIGEYFNITLPFWDAISIYGDASHQRGSLAWYPTKKVSDPATTGVLEVITFEQTRQDEDRIYTLAVGGLRYDFEGGTVLRAEYIYDGASYSETEYQLGEKALARDAAPAQLALFEQNLERALSPGLELAGQRFVFASLLVPDALDVIGIYDFDVYLRTLRSVRDHSMSSYASIDYAVGDAGSILGSIANQNDTGDELRGFSSHSYLLGYKHQW